jgi:hypothetical protein
VHTFPHTYIFIKISKWLLSYYLDREKNINDLQNCEFHWISYIFSVKYVAYIENGLTWVLFYLDRKYVRLHQRKIAGKHKLHSYSLPPRDKVWCFFLFLTKCTLVGFFHQIVLNSNKDMYNSPIVLCNKQPCTCTANKFCYRRMQLCAVSQFVSPNPGQVYLFKRWNACGVWFW